MSCQYQSSPNKPCKKTYERTEQCYSHYGGHAPSYLPKECPFPGCHKKTSKGKKCHIHLHN